MPVFVRLFRSARRVGVTGGERGSAGAGCCAIAVDKGRSRRTNGTGWRQGGGDRAGTIRLEWVEDGANFASLSLLLIFSFLVARGEDRKTGRQRYGEF
jgi:hypothetical protein